MIQEWDEKKQRQDSELSNFRQQFPLIDTDRRKLELWPEILKAMNDMKKAFGAEYCTSAMNEALDEIDALLEKAAELDKTK